MYVNGDSTERLAQHDDYGHVGEKKQFCLDLSRQLQYWGYQTTPLSLG